jgi:hypothetical protein
MSDKPTDAPEAGTVKWREIASEAIRFWERMRLVYCGILALVVMAYFMKYWPASLERLDAEFLMTLFLLAVLANVLYSLAYLPDVFVQMSEFRPAWRRLRWILFAVGMIFAAIVTRFVVMDAFGRHWVP